MTLKTPSNLSMQITTSSVLSSRHLLFKALMETPEQCVFIIENIGNYSELFV